MYRTNIFAYSATVQKQLSARLTRTVNWTCKMERKFTLCWSESTKWNPESTKWNPESTKWGTESLRGLIRINKVGHRINKVRRASNMQCTVQWTVQCLLYCTVQCTLQCTVKCSVQCTLYYWVWPILQYKAKLRVSTLNRRPGVYIS